MVTLKYMNLLLHIDIHRQSVKYIINEQSVNINVFLPFFSFVFFQIERERERGYTKLGIRRNSPKGTYLIFLTGFHWRIFLLLRANRLYAIFNTGLKNLGPSCPRYFFVFFTRSTGFWSVCHEPCPITNFSYYLFPLTGGGVPTSVLGSQPITWLLSSSRCQATRVRLPSTNICWSPLCDLHSFLTVTLWWLATVNSNTGNSINLISIVSVGHHVTFV